MDAEIFRNLPGNPNWEGSFYEQLTEYGIWNSDEFWKLHLALTEAALRPTGSEFIDRKVALAVATLQAEISRLVSAHYDANDVFEIKNLTPTDLHAFYERFEHAVLSVYSGEVLPESSYDLVNPLASSA